MTGTLVVANLIGRNATNSAGVPTARAGCGSRTRATTRSAACSRARATSSPATAGATASPWWGPPRPATPSWGTRSTRTPASASTSATTASPPTTSGTATPARTTSRTIPVLSAVSTNGASVHIAGALTATPQHHLPRRALRRTPSSAIPAASAKANATWVPRPSTTDATGDAVIDVTLTAAVAAGEHVTATATDLLEQHLGVRPASLAAAAR